MGHAHAIGLHEVVPRQQEGRIDEEGLGDRVGGARAIELRPDDRGGVAVGTDLTQRPALERQLFVVTEHRMRLEALAHRVPWIARVVRRRGVPAVSAERLIRALAGEHDLERPAGLAGEREHRQERRVAMRLFGVADHVRQRRQELVARAQDVGRKTERARHLRRTGRLIEFGTVEADRERLGRSVLRGGHGPRDRR